MRTPILAEKIILAQNEKVLELVVGSFGPVAVGDHFDRDPLLNPGSWRVVKVFEFEEAAKISSLITLMGRDAVKKLFRADLLIIAPA